MACVLDCGECSHVHVSIESCRQVPSARLGQVVRCICQLVLQWFRSFPASRSRSRKPAAFLLRALHKEARRWDSLRSFHLMAIHGVALACKGLCGYIQRPVNPAVLRAGRLATDLCGVLLGGCGAFRHKVSTPPQTLRAAVRSLSWLCCAVPPYVAV